jgi:hypothetical protein
MFLDKYYDIQNPIAKTAITVAEIYLMYQSYKWGKDEINYWKAQQELKRQQQAPTIPAGTYDVPAWGTQTQTQAFNPYVIAGQLYTAYNPDGYFTDEQEMSRLVAKIPPKYFNQVAVEYAKRGRNLMNDLDEQLTGIYQWAWEAYKAEVNQVNG